LGKAEAGFDRSIGDLGYAQPMLRSFSKMVLQEIWKALQQPLRNLPEIRGSIIFFGFKVPNVSV
jgi:hypothetical protein